MRLRHQAKRDMAAGRRIFTGEGEDRCYGFRYPQDHDIISRSETAATLVCSFAYDLKKA